MRHSGPSDEDLVRQAQRGSAEAFAVLVTRYQDRVYNTCLRMCHQHADALDLTQSVFLKALESLPRFESRANFYTWLYRIAVNLTITLRRSQRRRRVVSLDQPAPDGAPRNPAAEREPATGRRAEDAEEHERVARALSCLEEEFRAPVILKDVEGMDYNQIAEVLEIPVGTVKSRIHRGRMMLRELLIEKRKPVARSQD